MDRQVLGNVSLNLKLHEGSRQAHKVSRWDRVRPEEEIRNHIIDEACRLIANDLKEAMQKDLKARIAPAKVHNFLQKRRAADLRTQQEESSKATAVPIASTSTLEEVKIEPDLHASSLGNQQQSNGPSLAPGKSGTLKLPSFARSKKALERQRASERDYDHQGSHSPRSSTSRFDSMRPSHLPQRPYDSSSHRADSESVFSESVIDEDMRSEASSATGRRSASPRKSNGRHLSPMDLDHSPRDARLATSKRGSSGTPRKHHTIDYTSSEDDDLNEAINRAGQILNEEPVIEKPKSRSVDYTSSEDEAWQPAGAAQSTEDQSVDITADIDAPVPAKLLPHLPIKKQPAKKTPAPRRPVEVKPSQDNDPFEMGIAQDEEDLYYLRLALERLHTGASLHPEPVIVDEEATDGPHQTGSARTEGYYKIAAAQKSSYLPQRNRAMVDVSNTASSISVSRNARASTRALVHGIEQQRKTAATDTDVLKFNQLRVRKKQLKFARSPIRQSLIFYPDQIANI